MGKISISDIDNQLTYEGYLWWNDKENPDIIQGEVFDRLPEEDANPFVVEGQLYNQAKGISYSIKYVDGQYIVYEYTVTEDDKKSPNEIKTYLSNRMDGRWLQFLRYWEEVEDTDAKLEAYPKGLGVLRQTKNVFIGFKK